MLLLDEKGDTSSGVHMFAAWWVLKRPRVVVTKK